MSSSIASALPGESATLDLISGVYMDVEVDVDMEMEECIEADDGKGLEVSGKARAWGWGWGWGLLLILMDANNGGRVSKLMTSSSSSSSSSALWIWHQFFHPNFFWFDFDFRPSKAEHNLSSPTHFGLKPHVHNCILYIIFSFFLFFFFPISIYLSKISLK